MSEVIKLSSPATREFWELPVLFEDGHLLALDKPAGLLTSPDRYDPARPNLMKLLHAGIEREPVSRCSLQFDTHPVMGGIGYRRQYLGFACEVLNHNIQCAAIEQVPDRKAPA